MSVLFYLIPLALIIGFAGLLTFLWCMRTNQFEDLDGAARRILDEGEEEDRPPTP